MKKKTFRAVVRMPGRGPGSNPQPREAMTSLVVFILVGRYMDTWGKLRMVICGKPGVRGSVLKTRIKLTDMSVEARHR